MKRPLILRTLFASGAMLVSAACPAADTGTGPVVPVIPQCEINHTADIAFENRSNTNKTYDIIWDGSHITTVGPGRKSDYYTVAANVQHTLRFKITNGNADACAASTPTPSQCTTFSYWCTG